MLRPKFWAEWIFCKCWVSSKLEQWQKNRLKSWNKLIWAMKISFQKKSQVSLLLQRVCVFGSVLCRLYIELKNKSSRKSLNWKELNNHLKSLKANFQLNKKHWNKFKIRLPHFKETMKTLSENHNHFKSKKKSPPFNLYVRKSLSVVSLVRLRDGK